MPDDPATATVATATPAPLGVSHARDWRVGDVLLDTYEIRSVLGEGGMGRVYKAFHRGWGLELAIKTPREDILFGAGAVESFVREAETWVALGLHPNVVTAYYVRTIGAVPRVFAEYVAGGSLADAIRSRTLYDAGPVETLRRVLDTCIQVARGLAHAHEHSLVHQDVKPANVMLTSAGLAKVTDFGLSRRRAAATQHADGAGEEPRVSFAGLTPAYCSPEQAARRTLSRATDAWSLAVSILEMLAGEVTWSSGIAAPDVLDSMLADGPADAALPRIPDDLAALVRACLEEDGDRRLADMGEIARRLERMHERHVGRAYPRARPPKAMLVPDTLNNRAVSLLDLDRVASAEEALSSAVDADPHHPDAVFNQAVLEWRSGRVADDEAVRSVSSLVTSEKRKAEKAILLAWLEAERGNVAAANQAMATLPATTPDEDTKYRVSEVRHALASRPEPAPPQVIALGRPIIDARISADGRTLAAVHDDRSVRLWDLAAKTSTVIEPAYVTAPRISMSPDASHVALASESGLRIWQRANGIARHVGILSARCVGLSSGGAALAAIDGQSRLLAAEGPAYAALSEVKLPSEGTIAVGDSVAISDLGLFVVATRGYPYTTLRVASKRGQQLAVKIPDAPELVRIAARAAIALTTHTAGAIGVCDVAEALRASVLPLAAAPSIGVGAQAMQRVFALSQLGSRLKAFDKGCRRLRGHGGRVVDAALTADGADALSIGDDETLRVWDVGEGRCVRTLAVEAGARALLLPADGDFVMWLARDGTLRSWSWGHVRSRPRAPYSLSRVRATEDLIAEYTCVLAEVDEAIAALAKGATSAALAHVAKARAFDGYAQAGAVVDAWDAVARQRERGELRGVSPLRTMRHSSDRAFAVATSADGRTVAYSMHGDASSVRVRRANGDVQTIGNGPPAGTIAISRDGKLMATCGVGESSATVWRLDRDARPNVIEKRDAEIYAVAMSASGRWLACVGEDGVVNVHDLAGRVERLSRSVARSLCVALSPEGRVACVGAADGTLHVFDVSSGKVVKKVRASRARIRAVAVGPYGALAVSGSDDGTARVWDVAAGVVERCALSHGAPINAVGVDAGARIVLTGGEDGAARIWSLRDGRLLHSIRDLRGAVRALALTPDGRTAIVGGIGDTIRTYRLDWGVHDRATPIEAIVASRILDAFAYEHGDEPAGGADLDALTDALGNAGLGGVEGAAIVEALRRRETSAYHTPAARRRWWQLW